MELYDVYLIFAVGVAFLFFVGLTKNIIDGRE